MTATPRSAARTAGAHVCFLNVARTALSARIRSAAPPKLADILEARASVAYQGDTEQRDEAVPSQPAINRLDVSEPDATRTTKVARRP